MMPDSNTISSDSMLSVVLPVYNSDAYLERCISYIENQTYNDFEVILVNDGSTDRTGVIAENWSKVDSRVKYVYQNNSGPGAARNIGMSLSRGKYLLFLDPDDHFSANFFSELVNTAESSKADIVICSSDSIDHETNERHKEDWHLRMDLIPKNIPFSGASISKFAFQFTIGWPWDKLFKRSFVDENKIVYPNLKNSEDGAFVFPLICVAERIAIVSDILISHEINRSNSISFSRSNGPVCFAEAITTIKYRLSHFGIDSQFKESFSNWAIDFSLWNLNSAPEHFKRDIATAIEKVVFPIIQFDTLPESIISNTDQYHQCKLLHQYGYDASNEIIRLEQMNLQLQNELNEIKKSKSFRLAKTISKAAQFLK